MRTDKKNKLLKLRRWRTRKIVSGTSQRPRMSVKFTQKNIHVQFVDDTAGKTLVAASTLCKTLENRDKMAANVKSAETIGTVAAELALKAGIQEVVFDRSGARYHGKVKALADAARKGGLKF
jgi:large subunit ribosomal protein L18